MSWATTIVFHIKLIIDYYTIYFIGHCSIITP